MDRALMSEQRYLPFGQVRSDVGAVIETDFGYTGQRDLDAQEISERSEIRQVTSHR